MPLCWWFSKKVGTPLPIVHLTVINSILLVFYGLLLPKLNYFLHFQFHGLIFLLGAYRLYGHRADLRRSKTNAAVVRCDETDGNETYCGRRAPVSKATEQTRRPCRRVWHSVSWHPYEDRSGSDRRTPSALSSVLKAAAFFFKEFLLSNSITSSWAVNPWI